MTDVIIYSKNNQITYIDSIDHFENGLLRLMKLSKSDFNKWLDYSEEIDGNLIEKLQFGFHKLKNYKKSFPMFDNIYFSSILENENYGVMISKKLSYLVRERDFEREVSPPIYEEDYFEGDLNKSGGYGQYALQETWRLEKSTRQVEEIIKNTNLKKGNCLDIGSGYGYFRQALSLAGFNHQGIEVSKYACQFSKEKYDFDTLNGTILDFVDKLENQFDIITMWDVIEHVPDPGAFLKLALRCLKSNGFLIIKTPNIDCPEVEIFGGAYHSFKREHLIYFSPETLKKCAEESGFKVFKMESNSHLLRGFFPEKTINDWSVDLKGADLIFYLVPQ